jgi:hypothetical protein
MTMGYWLDGSGSTPAKSWRFLCHIIQTGSGAYPASYPLVKGDFLSVEVKWLGNEADHSPQSSAEVKKCRAISPPPYVFMAYLIRDIKTVLLN